jgi:hypothetical protein
MFPQMIGTTLQAQRATKSRNDRRMEAAFDRRPKVVAIDRLAEIQMHQAKIEWGMDNMDSRLYPRWVALHSYMVAVHSHHLYGTPYPTTTLEEIATLGFVC